MSNEDRNDARSYRASDPGAAPRQLQCPKCDAPMARVVHESIEVDRCEGCQGIWFDMLEMDRLLGVPGSEAIDTGDPAIGRELNKKDTIACPVCSTLMIRMVDADQPHIWYEACATCHGVFLDAGEFVDLKTHDFFDLFRRWLARARR